MTTKPEKTEESTSTVSRKREITATVASGVVAVALGLVANALVGKLAENVKNRIAPQDENE